MYSQVSTNDWLRGFLAKARNLSARSEANTAAAIAVIEKFAQAEPAQDAGPGDAVEIVEIAPVQSGIVTGKQVGPYRLPRTHLLKATEPTPVDPLLLRKQANTVIVALRNQKIDIDCRKVIVSPSAVRMLCKFVNIPGKTGRIADVKTKEQELVLALAVASLRVVFPVMDEPGMFAIEIPRRSRSVLTLRDLIETATVEDLAGALPVPIGLTTDGVYRWLDLASAPHVLVAGSTGSGKSVFIGSTLSALLMTKTPEELRLALIDVKGELNQFGAIPHLIAPVVGPEQGPAAAAMLLQHVVDEMERRSLAISKARARNIAEYNVDRAHPMPRLVVVVDEAAMLTDENDDKDSALAIKGMIAKIARFARSTGIHLIIGIQRPDVSFIAGETKANLPVRVAFKLTNQTDSQTVIGKAGAEKLKGRGDGLLWLSDDDVARFQAPFISGPEVENLVFHWSRYPAPAAPVVPTAPAVTVSVEAIRTDTPAPQVAPVREAPAPAPVRATAPAPVPTVVAPVEEVDGLVAMAADLVKGQATVSARHLQRVLKVRYDTAAAVLKALVAKGILSADAGAKGHRVIA